MKEFKFRFILRNQYDYSLTEMWIDIFSHNIQSAVDEFIEKGLPDGYELYDYKMR